MRDDPYKYITWPVKKCQQAHQDTPQMIHTCVNIVDAIDIDQPK